MSRFIRQFRTVQIEGADQVALFSASADDLHPLGPVDGARLDREAQEVAIPQAQLRELAAQLDRLPSRTMHEAAQAFEYTRALQECKP